MHDVLTRRQLVGAITEIGGEFVRFNVLISGGARSLYMDGAVRAGERAAREVLAALRR
jgi:hypothetical protein